MKKYIHQTERNFKFYSMISIYFIVDYYTHFFLNDLCNTKKKSNKKENKQTNKQTNKQKENKQTLKKTDKRKHQKRRKTLYSTPRCCRDDILNTELEADKIKFLLQYKGCLQSRHKLECDKPLDHLPPSLFVRDSPFIIYHTPKISCLF